MRTLALPLAALALLFAACGAPSEEPPAATLTITGAISPDPVIVGQHTLTLEVKDADGAAVPGATVTVSPWMPMMGHGSNEDAVITDEGAGTYIATPVTFTMAGKWEVTVTAEAGTATGEQVFTYMVE